MKATGFARQFMRDPRQTGAILPSSPALCRQLALDAGVKDALTVLEIGTGTGVVTAEIARQISAAAYFVAIEINPAFATVARTRVPTADIVIENAVNAPAILAERGCDTCDCVISGLPWAVFPGPLQDDLLDAVKASLRPGGAFVTFAYVHGLKMAAARRFRDRLQEHFGEVERSRVVWANVPPAIVYRVCKGT